MSTGSLSQIVGLQQQQLVETTSGSQLNDRKQSISNLEKQYSAPLGQRLVMGIQIDAKCLEGGLEAVAKRARQEKQMQLHMLENGVGNTASLVSPGNNQNSSSVDVDQNGMTSIDFNQNASGIDNGTVDSNASGDPFSFLSEASSPPQQSQQKESSSGSRGRKFGMGFLKKVAARTSDTLERGMQGLAVRMDQGKNADLVRVAIYDPTTNELLGVTESLPVPGMALESSDDSQLGDYNGQQQQQQQPKNAPRDLRFEVPLWVPGSRRKQSLLLKVWIQSGATLVLQSSKSAKNYLLGSAMVNCQALTEGVTAVALHMTTTSGALHGIPLQQGPPPRLQLCVLPDPKFSPILTRGWSLTDPDMSGYSSTLNYLPLDQSYVFPGKQANHWLIAHERATESTVPLPIAASMTQLAADACDRSLAHAQSVARILRNNRHDHKDPLHKATCHLGVLGVVAGPGYSVIPGVTKATISVAWRRPDSIFEFEIAANETIPAVGLSGPTPGGYVSLKRTFYPKLCSPSNGDHILPGILQAYGGRMPSIGCFLGGVYFSVNIQTPSSSSDGAGVHSNQRLDSSDPFGPTGAVNEAGQQDEQQLWETVLGLEAFVKAASTSSDSTNNPTQRIQTMQVPVRRGSEDVGHLLLQLQVTLPEGYQTGQSNAGANVSNEYMATLPATDGLVSLVGMDSLFDGVKPCLDSIPVDSDNNSNSNSPMTQGSNHSATTSLRHQQLDTMGFFFTTQYMEQHLALRQSACDAFRDRARSYKYALSQPEKNALPHTLKTPKNFRPSSSRMTALLSGLPFNCHIASLNINVMDAIRPRQPAAGGAAPEYPGASFHNVTCGAPADHARGFGNILQNVSAKNVSGGLRRLEAQRKDYAQHLQQAQSNLITGIGNYLTEARKNAPAGAAVHHVPARHAQIQQLRWRVFECVHILHHITWMCAVRRANVFSQSLGLAVSGFLASLSDQNKCAAGWPSVWAQHGFLVCFEGLLSAAGKELGMIEDASIAIAMLRMVSIVLVSAEGDVQLPSKAIPIPSSPYLRWTKITAEGGDGSARKFILEIGIDPAYYNERIPPPLKNNAPVRLFPILFEVGVDIRQWGANTGSNLRKSNAMNSNNGIGDQQSSVGNLEDDGDEDDVGIVDDDILVALNYEAMRKMNCYAHALSPQQIPLEQVVLSTERVFESSSSSSSITGISADPNKDQLPIHPSLAALHSHILSSAGKMNHSILDEAATIAQQLGGGGLVFCKSGKDRTAMHLTYKQCQFAGRYRGNHDQTAILRDASLLRLHGTRLPICEKNVGQALYAFNSLQVKFMPEALKPPMDTLAGFLKGGEIFRGGGIET